MVVFRSKSDSNNARVSHYSPGAFQNTCTLATLNPQQSHGGRCYCDKITDEETSTKTTDGEAFWAECLGNIHVAPLKTTVRTRRQALPSPGPETWQSPLRTAGQPQVRGEDLQGGPERQVDFVCTKTEAI